MLEGHYLSTIDTALLLFVLWLFSDSHFLFAISVSSDFFLFCVSSVVVWCVSAAVDGCMTETCSAVK
jgi:hypothetical protein